MLFSTVSKQVTETETVTWASLRWNCTVTNGWDTRCGTDEFSDRTRRQLRNVWRWCEV